MKNCLLAFFTIVLLALGGCAGKYDHPATAELPETPAFHDKFTRSYMASPKEAEPGYYLFKSKTGGYTMLFPKNGVISAGIGQEQVGDYFEEITYLSNENINNQVIFSNKSTAKNIDAYKEMVSDKVGYRGSLKKRVSGGKEIYFGKQLDDSQGLLTFYYFSFIKNASDYKSIQFFYTATCKKKDKSCSGDKFEQNALMLMESVRFINK